jgi:hypothetical protein
MAKVEADNTQPTSSTGISSEPSAMSTERQKRPYHRRDQSSHSEEQRKETEVQEQSPATDIIPKQKRPYHRHPKPGNLPTTDQIQNTSSNVVTTPERQKRPYHKHPKSEVLSPTDQTQNTDSEVITTSKKQKRPYHRHPKSEEQSQNRILPTQDRPDQKQSEPNTRVTLDLLQIEILKTLKEQGLLINDLLQRQQSFENGQTTIGDSLKLILEILATPIIPRKPNIISIPINQEITEPAGKVETITKTFISPYSTELFLDDIPDNLLESFKQLQLQNSSDSFFEDWMIQYSLIKSNGDVNLTQKQLNLAYQEYLDNKGSFPQKHPNFCDSWILKHFTIYHPKDYKIIEAAEKKYFRLKDIYQSTGLSASIVNQIIKKTIIFYPDQSDEVAKQVFNTFNQTKHKYTNNIFIANNEQILIHYYMINFEDPYVGIDKATEIFQRLSQVFENNKILSQLSPEQRNDFIRFAILKNPQKSEDVIYNSIKRYQLLKTEYESHKNTLGNYFEEALLNAAFFFGTKAEMYLDGISNRISNFNGSKFYDKDTFIKVLIRTGSSSQAMQLINQLKSREQISIAKRLTLNNVIF